MTRRPLAAALSTLALAVGMLAPGSAVAQVPTKTPGQLVVGVSMPAAGFQVGAVRGRDVLFAKGYEIDLAKAIARELGVPSVRFVQVDRFSAFFEAGAKDYDLALSQITITDARDAVIDFSRPYFVADQAVLLRRGLSLPKRRFSQLRTLRLCAERATSGARQAKRIRPRRPVRVFGDASRLEAELYHRRCDAVIGDAARLGALRAQAPQRLGELAGRIKTGERYGAAFETGSGLRGPVDAALDALEEDGTLGRLAADWLSTDLTRLRVFR
jgi:polar amino acid transport system substrate-binding protein